MKNFILIVVMFYLAFSLVSFAQDKQAPQLFKDTIKLSKTEVSPGDEFKVSFKAIDESKICEATVTLYQVERDLDWYGEKYPTKPYPMVRDIIHQQIIFEDALPVGDDFYEATFIIPDGLLTKWRLASIYLVDCVDNFIQESDATFGKDFVFEIKNSSYIDWESPTVDYENITFKNNNSSVTYLVPIKDDFAGVNSKSIEMQIPCIYDTNNVFASFTKPIATLQDSGNFYLSFDVAPYLNLKGKWKCYFGAIEVGDNLGNWTMYGYDPRPPDEFFFNVEIR